MNCILHWFLMFSMPEYNLVSLSELSEHDIMLAAVIHVSSNHEIYDS